jgi:hypothetical protein
VVAAALVVTQAVMAYQAAVVVEFQLQLLLLAAQE